MNSPVYHVDCGANFNWIKVVDKMKERISIRIFGKSNTCKTSLITLFRERLNAMSIDNQFENADRHNYTLEQAKENFVNNQENFPDLVVISADLATLPNGFSDLYTAIVVEGAEGINLRNLYKLVLEPVLVELSVGVVTPLPLFSRQGDPVVAEFKDVEVIFTEVTVGSTLKPVV